MFKALEGHVCQAPLFRVYTRDPLTSPFSFFLTAVLYRHAHCSGLEKTLTATIIMWGSPSLLRVW